MEEKYLVEGYEFDSLEEANEAKRELEAVHYLAQKTRESSPEITCKIYYKLAEQKLFHTPVGTDFMKVLEDYLVQNRVMETVQGDNRAEDAAEKLKKAEMVQEKERKERKAVEQQLKRTKDRLATSLVLNVVLIIAIAVMMYIASTSSNINILNYETALQDKYSSWEQDLRNKEKQLKEREAVIVQKETELKIGTEAEQK